MGDRSLGPKQQAEVLRRGVGAWFEWRRANPAVAVTLADQDLSGLDLAGVDLHGADLTGTVFVQTNLDHANLQGATLQGVVVNDATFRGADFRNARLQHAPLHRVDCRGADFRGAIFEREGHLSNCNLQEANFEGVDLREVYLPGCDLRRARLVGANLRKADLERIDLREAKLERADFAGASLRRAMLVGADLGKLTMFECDFRGSHLTGTHLQQSDLRMARFDETNLTGAYMGGAWLEQARFDSATLTGAHFDGANLTSAVFTGADLSGALLERANLTDAVFRNASLAGANLQRAVLVRTDLRGADLRSALVYGIAAWDVQTSGSDSKGFDLVITPPDQPQIVVDDIEVAQFTYLLLHNPNIRRVIDTISRRGVLILGRFTPERKVVLDALRDELRRQHLVPFLFDFDRPADRNVRETVSILAGLSLFVIADLTQPASIPLELQAVIPQLEIPVAPIIAEGHQPFGMFPDLYNQYRSDRGGHVLGVQSYPSIEVLTDALGPKIIEPAVELANTLRARKAAPIDVRSLRSD